MAVLRRKNGDRQMLIAEGIPLLRNILEVLKNPAVERGHFRIELDIEELGEIGKGNEGIHLEHALRDLPEGVEL